MQQLTKKVKDQFSPLEPSILQFGGGNFLRGFIDWIIDVYNEKMQTNLGVVVVKPTERGTYQEWENQQGLYHILTRGIQDGKLIDESRLITCIHQILHAYHDWQQVLATAENPSIRFIVSNTTENGIRTNEDDQRTDSPPSEFPAKLTRWLYHRFDYFKGSKESGCIMIPTELIVDNGQELRACVLKYAEQWALGAAFRQWIVENNFFCNTLVDRIVPGVPSDQLEQVWAKVGYEDSMVTMGEPYHFFAIEANTIVQEQFPIDKIGLHVLYTDDLTPYRIRKVRILNGAHTVMVPVAYLYGLNAVRESIEHEVVGRFVRHAIFKEIIPILDLPKQMLVDFADAVIDRFKNPFIHHQLLSISLNSISKFKTRVLPGILAYYSKRKALPEALVFSLAATACFYRGKRGSDSIPLNDGEDVLAFFDKLWEPFEDSDPFYAQLSRELLAWEEAWDKDLNSIPGLTVLVTQHIRDISRLGMPRALEELLAPSGSI